MNIQHIILRGIQGEVWGTTRSRNIDKLPQIINFCIRNNLDARAARPDCTSSQNIHQTQTILKNKPHKGGQLLVRGKISLLKVEHPNFEGHATPNGNEN